MSAESWWRMRVVALWFATASSLFAADLRAAGDIFVWVDEHGDLHATDVLSSVPEPYYSMYAAQLAERERERQRAENAQRAATSGEAAAGPGAAPATPPVAPPAPPPPVAPPRRAVAGADATQWLQEEMAKERDWRARVAQARLDLATATTQLQDAEARLAELRMNPILALTPQVQAEIAAQSKQVELARQRALDAREYLLVELPAAARKAKVPRQWLQ